MGRLLLAIPLVLLFLVPATAAPDARSAWKKAHKNHTKRYEKPYWDQFERRLGEVYAEWRTEYSYWSGDWEANRHEVHTLDTARKLYEEYVEIQADRVPIDEDFAQSDDPSAAEELFDALMDLVEECVDLDKEIAGGRPVAYYSLMFEQAPAVKRHGLATRVEGLVSLLANIKGAAPWVAETGWALAVKGDKKKSLARRTATLDILGQSKDPAGRAHLEATLGAPEPGLRIVALENLVAYGVDTQDRLKPLLADPAPQVRRALLETIARRGAEEARWIPLAFEAYKSQEGLVRARALEALAELSGQVLPDEKQRWEAWYAKHAQDIKDGVWKRPEPKKPPEPEKKKDGDGDKKDEKEAAEPERHKVTAKPLTTFYGIGAPSRYVIFAFDGSTDMDMPADLQTMLTKSKRLWQATASKWRKDMLAHRTFLLRELDACIEYMPEDARFALIHLWGTNPAKIPVMGAKKVLQPKKSTRKKVEKTIEKQRPQGQFSVDEATRLAFEVCGQDPFADPEPGDVLLDSVFLLAPGWIGGRWAIPEAAIADFERWNRYHRLQVNTIRVTDRKEESERLMQGLAEASGGAYWHMTELP